MFNHEKHSTARQAIICQEHRIEAGLASIIRFSDLIIEVNTLELFFVNTVNNFLLSSLFTHKLNVYSIT